MIRTSQRGQGGNRAKDVRGPEVEGGEEEQQSERWIKCEQEGGEGCEAEMWQKRQRGGNKQRGGRRRSRTFLDPLGSDDRDLRLRQRQVISTYT